MRQDFLIIVVETRGLHFPQGGSSVTRTLVQVIFEDSNANVFAAELGGWKRNKMKSDKIKSAEELLQRTLTVSCELILVFPPG